MAAIPESEFQNIIHAMCEERGILYHHCAHPYTCQGQNGFPDLVLVGRHVLFCELKNYYGRLKPQQNTYRARLLRAGAQYALWRPRDLYNGVVDAAMDDLTS